MSEQKAGEVYRARLELNRAAYAFVKITWNPDLRATVDGRPAEGAALGAADVSEIPT